LAVTLAGVFLPINRAGKRPQYGASR